MSAEDDKLQIKNPEMHHIPISVPCYAHALSLDLSRSLENILELKVFFGYINSIVRFLNKSTKISTMFELFSERSITEVTETECHLHSRIVTVVYSLRSDIMQTLNFILTSFENWDNETISQAESLSNTFEDKHFNFLLCVISEIFTKTDTLFNDSENSNVSIDAGAIEDFLSWINFKFVNKLDNFLKKVNDLVYPFYNQRKLHVEMESRSHYKKLLINIKENIMCQIKYRYKSFNKLSFLNLMNKDKYDSFSKLFPEELLNDLVSNFKGVFHFSALKNELNILYTTASLKEKQDIYDIYLHISNDVIKDIFPQLLKLCTIFLTLPIPIASIEKSFSALERIRTYLQNSQSKSRLPISSLISIENKLLLNIRNKPSFYNDVLSEFLKMDHRIALEYK
ncbi:uncharacterized protein LOC119683297 [Teleopsis dalmanni]|uniref:uncharacterized protein LOC119683297 n=1 Tax=Teleopsis dalmanni TaxID=139649 RepID=UPI0018CF5560|nr:uncharacterized protein LOC119683297 [Teleopsis dalmanni]